MGLKKKLNVLMNHKKYKYSGVNQALKHVVGDYIAIADAHSIYPREYISRSVRELDNSNADNVGGGWIVHPRTKGLLAKSITFALTTPFGICT